MMKRRANHHDQMESIINLVEIAMWPSAQVVHQETHHRAIQVSNNNNNNRRPVQVLPYVGAHNLMHRTLMMNTRALMMKTQAIQRPVKHQCHPIHISCEFEFYRLQT